MQRGLRQIGRPRGLVANGHLDSARNRGRLGFDPRRAVPNQDQQTPLGSGMFHRDAHELLDQSREHDLTRNGLRSSNDRLDVQLFNRRADRDRRRRSASLV